MRFKQLVLFWIFAGAGILPALADPVPVKAEALTAEQILSGIDASSFIDASHMTAEVEMTIQREGRKPKTRVFQVKSQKNGNLVNYLIQFLAPKSIRGSAFMVRGNANGLPDQYIYLPATKIVKKVAGGNALSSFFGSDFSYGDLLPMPDSTKENLRLKRLSDETLRGQKVYRIEITPQIKGSPYGKLVLSLNKIDKMPMEIQYFDGDFKPLKTMTLEKISDFGGKKMPTHIKMRSDKKPQFTDLIVKKVDTQAKFDGAQFTQSAMKRL